MEVRNCRQCGRLFNYIGGSYSYLCPNCVKKLEEKFHEVKEYIEDNKNATMVEIAEACDVSTKQLEKWVREERLCFSPESSIGIECEICGTTIKSGRYCEQCKGKIANDLGGMYKKPEKQPEVKKDNRTSAKMRYLDK